jgi:hypothetical protein
MGDKNLSLAAEVYLYGYPLVYNLEVMIDHAARKLMTSSLVNNFGHAKALLGPEVAFGAANDDTLYSSLKRPGDVPSSMIEFS